MPSRKKKSRAKGRKPAVGKGDAIRATDEGTLNSEMRRLRIGEQQTDGGDDALLEEAIKLAAVEQQEIEENEKECCTHGYNPLSKFQAQFCEDFMKKFMESYYASTREGRQDRLCSFIVAMGTATKSTKTTNTSRNKSNNECISPFCVAEGTKFILDGKSDDARLCGVLALYMKGAKGDDEWPDIQKILELLDGDDHTLVQFFRKQIPCSCLDEKYKEVKSITKTGICCNPECPLPRKIAVRSKMLRCTGCINHNASYCSRDCQEVHWPYHKIICGKTRQEVRAYLKK